MLIKLHSLEGAECGEMEVDDQFFPDIARPDIIKRVVDWQLHARRKGCHKVKTISEVSGSNRKPYAQKGTGRARRGSNRAVHMRGGGVAHGPVLREHGVDMPKKVRKLALRHVMADKLHSGKFFLIDGMHQDKVGTSAASKRLSWLMKPSVLMVDLAFEQNLALSCRNIPLLNMVPSGGLNVYDIVRHEVLALSKGAFEEIKSRIQNER